MLDPDIEVLIGLIFGLDIEAQKSYDSYDLEDYLSELSYDHGLLYMFHKLIQSLLPLIEMGESPLTKTKYKGFVHPEKSHQWLAKTEL